MSELLVKSRACYQHAYFDLEKERESQNEHVKRVASHLSSVETKLLVHFAKFFLHPLTSFNAVFQTTSKISTMQSDIPSFSLVFCAQLMI